MKSVRGRRTSRKKSTCEKTEKTMIDKRYGRIENNANCLDIKSIRRFTFAKHNQ